MALRVGIVGCGKIADGHIEEIAKMKAKAVVVAVCDLELLMAEQIAFRYGIPAFYDSYERMLESEKLDVVHITTPPQSHLALSLKALQAGCHVYVEKPLTMSYAESKQLIDAAKAAGKLLTIGYTYYFDPPARAMRQLLAEGALGDVVHVESFYGYHLDGQFGSAILGDAHHWVHRLPGKLFHNNIDHLLNKATEFLDDAEPMIRAFGYARREKRHGDARDSMLDELRLMVTGQRVSMFGTFSSAIRPTGHFVRVYGTRGSVHADYLSRTVTFEHTPTLPSAIGRLLPAFEQGLGYLREGGRNVLRFAQSDFHFWSGLNELIARFYASILEGKELPLSYRDILRISWMLDEIFRQVPQSEPAR